MQDISKLCMTSKQELSTKFHFILPFIITIFLVILYSYAFKHIFPNKCAVLAILSIRKLPHYTKAYNKNRSTTLKNSNRLRLIEAKSKSKICGSVFIHCYLESILMQIFSSLHLLITENFASHCFRQWRLREQKQFKGVVHI